MPKARTIASAIVTVVLVWAAAANIAPKIFGVQTEREAVISSLRYWLWNPTLIWLALPVAAIWFVWLLHRLSSQLDAVSAKAQATAEYVTGSQGIARANVRLDLHEARLGNIEERLSKIAPAALDFARQVLEGETFPVVYNGGATKEWTRKEIHALPDSQKAKLKKEEPELWQWYLQGA